jgi:hypothetical protein
MKRFFISLSLVLVSAVCVMAQTTAGRLTGTVSGPDGVLPGATVTATDNKTGRELTIVAGDEGNFLFPQLEFGTYTVKVTATGFKTYIANEVKIDVGRDYTLNPILEVGSVQESVTVTAGADVVTANTAQVSNTVSPQQILSLPLVTRNPLSLTGLQAGVSANSAQNTTINGMRTTFTNITRDGINIQDTFIRSNATDFAPGRPSVDDTGEFTITLTNAEADQGYGGAQIRLVTPRGTKDFSGALFAYNRNSAFSANNFFNNRSPNPAVNEKPPFRNRNQYGGKLSGPMPVPGFGEGTPQFYKDKGFFFFAYEGIKDPVSTAATRTILTPAALAGGFTYNRTNSTDNTPFCPSQTVGSLCTIPSLLTFARSLGGNFLTLPSTIDPVMQARVISQLPTISNFAGGDSADGVLRNTAGYRLIRRSDQTRDQYSTRIDVDFNDKNSILGVFNYNKELNLRPDADTTKFTVIPAVEQFSTNKQFTMAYRRVISPNFINEVRGGIFTSEVPFNKTDETPAFLFWGLPVTNPENTFLSQGRNTKAFNFQDNADYIWNNHTFRFGGQMQIFRVNSYNDAQIVPIANIGTAGSNTVLSSIPGGVNTTQLAMANSLLALFGGVNNSVTQFFNVADINSGFAPVRQFTPFRNENHSLYFSDRWLVSKNLTLTLGLRYELFPALRINNGLALEPIINDSDDINTALLNINGATQVVGGNAGRKNAYYKTDYNNFAPNLGISWSPSFESGIGKLLFGSEGKSVLRGGYSHIYGNDSIITSINNAGVGNPGLGRTGLAFINLSDRIQNGIRTVPPPAITPLPRSYLLNNAQNNFFGTVFGIDPDLESPKVEQYSFGYQREFFGNTAFEIRYVGSRSNNLVRGVDLNQIDIFNNGFLADFNRASRNLAINITERNSRIAACVAGGGTTATCTTQVNAALPQSAAFNSTLAGSSPLTLFPLLGTLSGTSGGVGTAGSGSAINGTVLTHILNGAPAELAFFYINSAANLNNHPSSLNPTAVPRINFLANPAAGAVDLMLNDAGYNYNSVQVEVRRRFANGLYFQGNYTFSKNLTNAIGTSQALFEPYLDKNNPDLDYQRADYDTTHVFSFNGIYHLPFGKGKMFLNNGGAIDKIFGGWEFAGIVQWFSGAPITFVDTRGTLNRAGRSARQTPFSTLTNDQIRALVGVYEQNGNIYFIDPAIIGAQGAASNGYGSAAFPGQVFFNVNPGQTGNVGRALIDGPSFFNINAALLKNIRFGERMRLQLRAESFNLLNNVNFNINSTQQLTNINSTSFGQLTSTANSAREFQFAIRFEF